MFRFTLVLFSIICCYLNFVIYKSYVMQVNIISDFNNQEFSNENFIKFKALGYDFPNLSGTAFPMYVLFAKYQMVFNDYDGALKTLNENNNVNPYLMVNESLSAEVYYKLGIRDSSYLHSKKAYENLPLNTRHFQQYITELTHRKDLDEINNTFLKSTGKENIEFWLYYFSGVINLKDENDYYIDSLANVALNKFPKDDRIKTISSYILYGQDKVQKSYELFNQGVSSFKNNNFDLASQKFIEANRLNPIDYAFSENAGMSLIKTGKFKEAIKYLEVSQESFDKPDDGKSEFGLGLCYKELGETSIACDYFAKAMNLNYKPAFGFYSSNCN